MSLSRQLHDALRLCRESLPVAPTCYWIAFSGGMDSHVLLHAMSIVKDSLNIDLRAVHVDHGLQAESEGWRRHCDAVCQQLNIPLTLLEADASAAKGESPEAAARDARYAAFAKLLGENEVLLTAQHSRDQAETLFLQLLRGAGPRGMAAMPKLTSLGRGYLCRPLLNVSYPVLENYASEQTLKWIEDPSNQEYCFDRNRLRHDVLPRLRERWPSLDATASRVAAQQAEAQQLLVELAEQDSAGLVDAVGSLDMLGVAELTMARQRNVLRHWLTQQEMNLPSSRQLAQLQKDMFTAATDRNPCVSWSGVEVRRYRDRLYAMNPLAEVDSSLRFVWQPGQALVLPRFAGTLLSHQVVGHGIALETHENKQFELRFRHGGENCRPQGKAHHTSLKKLFQKAGIPPWQRHRTPLIYVDDELAAIPGLCICEPFVATGNMTGFELDWQPAK